MFTLVETIDRLAIPEISQPSGGLFSRARAPIGEMALRLNSPKLTVDAGKSVGVSMGVYAGPSDKSVIDHQPQAYAAGIDKVVVYTLGGMCGMCTFLEFAGLLHGFLAFLAEHVVFDWAIGIMLLVVCVRTILHPVTRWSQKSLYKFGKDMGKLAPKQKAIQQKYKDDPTKMREELSRLMREEGVSYAGALGCLPAFLQTPVWIALSSMIAFAFELHHTPAFFGVFQKIAPHWTFLADLSSPDRFIPLPWSVSVPLMGNVDGINLLPLLMGVVFFLQQKYLQPPPTTALTPEQEQQQKMMKVMTVVMFPLMMYNAPSGLALYFATNSSIAIIESKLIRKKADEEYKQREAMAVVRAASRTSGDGGRAGAGWAASLESPARGCQAGGIPGAAARGRGAGPEDAGAAGEDAEQEEVDGEEREKGEEVRHGVAEWSRGKGAARRGGLCKACVTNERLIARLISRWFCGECAGVAVARVDLASAQEPGRRNGDQAEHGGTQGQARRDPYRAALVAEAMLQQTQVSRVVEKYGDFVERFPTSHALAAADEHEVLGMWSGLGYYRRARHLHAAARMIVAEFGGSVPGTVEELLRLPGVGRYTAGAIASIAHGERAPIVDGNVARVLLRIHGKDAASDDKSVQGWLWERAEKLVAAADEPGVFNEGLMELGATVCVPGPGRPRCGECPVAGICAARREGRELLIPRAKTRAARKTVYCAVAIVERADGAVLVEQRDGKGMWAGMWQAPTLEREDRAPTRAELARAVGVAAGMLERVDAFEFLATHRRMMFEVYRARAKAKFTARRGEFQTHGRIARLGLSSPQRRGSRGFWTWRARGVCCPGLALGDGCRRGRHPDDPLELGNRDRLDVCIGVKDVELPAMNDLRILVENDEGPGGGGLDGAVAGNIDV